MTSFELGRSDIGFGKLVVDDAGITRHRMIRTQRLAWDDIVGYRLGVVIENATGAWGRAFGWDFSAVEDFIAALRGKRTALRLSCELLSRQTRLMVNWRFATVELAIAEVMRRVGPRLLEGSLRELEQSGIARFGDLVVGKRGVQWRKRASLAFEAVEDLAIIDSTPVQLVVHRRGHAFAYARFNTGDIPNVLVALDVAERLGYRVTGREVLDTVVGP